MRKLVIVFVSVLLLAGCNNQSDVAKLIQGKVEREEIAIVGKIAGRINEILVHQGDLVKRGDTLAILDIPELAAKKAQASGAVKSAQAQYDMSVKGATENQLKQLNAKRSALNEQYKFAQKSLKRLEGMLSDSLIPQQQYDDVFAKYQGAQAQLIAVDAEIADVKNGVRSEQQTMALGQQNRALGALDEVQVAENERFILAPQDMQIESITLKLGELALPGYTLFKGTLQQTTYFRFTIPESQLKNYEKGKTVTVKVPYKDTEVNATIQHVKQIGAYANIASAYPDYDMQDPLYELIIQPKDAHQADSLLSKSTVTLNK